MADKNNPFANSLAAKGYGADGIVPSSPREIQAITKAAYGERALYVLILLAKKLQVDLETLLREFEVMIEPTEVEKQLEAQRLILLKQKKDLAIKSQVALKQAELTALRQDIASQQQSVTQAAAAAAVERMNQQKELRRKLNLPSQPIPSTEFKEVHYNHNHETIPVPDDESFYDEEKEEIEDAVIVNHDIVTWMEEADRKAANEQERRASLEEIKKERDRLLKLDKMMQDRKTARERLGGPNWLNK